MANNGLRDLRSAGTEQVGAFYDDWAASYDDDLTSYGYQAPELVAKTLADTLADRNAPVLDAGCGTGLSGTALSTVGYTHVTGIDVSPDSLDVARAKGCYELLKRQDLDATLAFDDNSFAAVTCIGTLAYIKNTQALMAEFCRVARPGAFIIFTQSNDFYTEAFTTALQNLVDNGSWKRHARTGPHPYMPNNPDYGEETTIYIETYEVLA